MNQLAEKALAQLLLSTIAQLANNPKMRELMTPAAQRNLENVKNIPKSIIDSGAFVIPDRPITALNDQDLPFKTLLDWYLSPQKSQIWFEQPSLHEQHEEAFNTKDDGGEHRQTEKNRAKFGLAFMTKFLGRASKSKAEAQDRYDRSRQRWEMTVGNKTLGTGVSTKAFQELVEEAAHLSGATDFWALVSLHYQKYLNEVTTAGFDVSAFSENSESTPDAPPQSNNSDGEYNSLSFFNIPPSVMNDFDKFYAACNQLFCVANDEELQNNYKNTGKPLYPLYAHKAYRELQAPIPSWVQEYIDELTTKALQSPDSSPDAAAWMVGFRDSPDSNAYCQSRSPRQWRDEIKRRSVRTEVLWREQENQGVTRTQIFKELALEYGCSEENITDWFYEKIEKKKERRREKRMKK